MGQYMITITDHINGNKRQRTLCSLINKPNALVLTSAQNCVSLLRYMCCLQLISRQSLTIRFVQSSRRHAIQVDDARRAESPFLESRLIKPAADEGILRPVFPRIPFVYQADINFVPARNSTSEMMLVFQFTRPDQSASYCDVSHGGKAKKAQTPKAFIVPPPPSGGVVHSKTRRPMGKLQPGHRCEAVLCLTTSLPCPTRVECTFSILRSGGFLGVS